MKQTPLSFKYLLLNVSDGNPSLWMRLCQMPTTVSRLFDVFVLSVSCNELFLLCRFDFLLPSRSMERGDKEIANFHETDENIRSH